jgi:hypothetical protein
MTPERQDDAARLVARWREEVREEFAQAAVARLDSTGTRVLCGRRDTAGRAGCGQALLHRAVDADTGEAGWWFSSAWIEGERRGAERVWRLPRHAKNKLRRSHAMASGQGGRWTAEERERARRWLAEGRPEDSRGRDDEPYYRRPRLPALAECPRCGEVSAIFASEL